MGKLPSMPVYVGDWMKDPELRRCHPSARGIWIDVMCLMWEAETRGILRKNGSSWTIKDVSDAIQGCAPRMVRELIEKGVMAVSKRKGTFYSKRMVRDELNRRRQARHGHRGGNPTLKGGVKGGVKGSLKAGGEPGALSSSSSSSSSSPSGSDKNPQTPKGGSRTDSAKAKNEILQTQAEEVIDGLNQITGRRFKPGKGNVKEIVRTLRDEKATVDECLLVVRFLQETDYRDDKWKADFIDCVTPFRSANWSKYLDRAVMWKDAGYRMAKPGNGGAGTPAPAMKPIPAPEHIKGTVSFLGQPDLHNVMIDSLKRFGISEQAIEWTLGFNKDAWNTEDEFVECLLDKEKECRQTERP